MTGSLIDPEGRCERCGRLVPIECPEPDGLSCGSYVLEVTAEEGEDTRALVERLRAMLPASPRHDETSIGYGQAKRPEPPPGARSILWQDPAAGPGRTGVIAARRITGDGEIRGPLVVITTAYPSGEVYTDPTPRLDPVRVGCPGGRECVNPGECVRISGCLRDAVPLEEVDEDAFFAAMDDLVEHVTGERPGARGCEADDQGPEDGVF